MTVKSVIELLGQMPLGKRILQAPAQIAELEARVEALEKRLETATGEKCPKCYQLSLELTKAHEGPDFEVMGVMIYEYECSNCGFKTKRQVRS